MHGTEDELESFRRAWREEVARKPNARPAPPQNPPGPSKPKGKQRTPLHAPGAEDDHDDTAVPARTFHDLPDREEHLQLGNEATRAQATGRSLETALDHYEQAVQHEVDGRLGDSVSAYRQAFKMDDRVHEQYKKKHFPASSFKKPPDPPKAASSTSSTAADAALPPPPPPPPPLPTDQLLASFADLSISRAPPPTDLSAPPPCPLADVPDEVLVAILTAVAADDVAVFARLAQVCKRLAYLAASENSIWRSVLLGARFGMRAMHYRYRVDLRGTPLLPLAAPRPVLDMTPAPYPTYRHQFRHRPRIRFNGVYISTVNYARPGQGAQSRSAWNNPVHIVTYYRYLRFFRDGTCLSLLTTTQPADVVHHLAKDNLHQPRQPSSLPASVVKDALHGRWRLSGPASRAPAASPVSSVLALDDDRDAPTPGPGEYAKEPVTDWSILGGSDDDEREGDVHIETDGVVPKYMWKMQFGMASAGRKDGPRNTKLNWKGFWYYNHLTDDWGEFGLKNDKPFYFSRVKSYGVGEG